MNVRHLFFPLGVLLGVAVLAMARAEETSGFARYRIILERAPFGPVNPAEKPAGQQPSYAARFTLVGIVQSNGVEGPMQAIIDDRGPNRRTFSRIEGESIDDVKIVRIETEPTCSVVIQRGLETGTLTFPEGGSAPAAAQGSVAPGQPPPGALPGGVPQPDAGSATIRRIPFRRPNQ